MASRGCANITANLTQTFQIHCLQGWMWNKTNFIHAAKYAIFSTILPSALVWSHCYRRGTNKTQTLPPPGSLTHGWFSEQSCGALWPDEFLSSFYKINQNFPRPKRTTTEDNTQDNPSPLQHFYFYSLRETISTPGRTLCRSSEWKSPLSTST